jgi:carboxyl-terminal processing protease
MLDSGHGQSQSTECHGRRKWVYLCDKNPGGATTSPRRRSFAHWEGISDLDYDVARTKFRTAATAAGDRRDFAFAAARFLALLENGHTDVSNARLWQELGAPLLFTLRQTGGEWVIASSRDGRNGVGSVISKVDGHPFEAFFREANALQSAFSEHWARRLLGSRFFLFPETLILTFADGREVEVERIRPTAEVPVVVPQVAAARVPHRWASEDSVALMRLPTFGSQEVENRALQLLRADLARASALVQDLRGNGGGNTPWKLREALPRGHAGHDWRWTVIDDNASTSLFMRVVAPIVMRHYSPPRWEGSLVLLVDAGCFSACEDLVGSLAGAPGVRVVGEATGGSTGQPVSLSLEEGFGIRVSARRLALPDGTPFEGRGILPDVRVARGIDDYRSGAEPMMEAAFEEAWRMENLTTSKSRTSLAQEPS